MKKKIVYILNVPSPQINVALFEELGKSKKWDLVMMTPDVARRLAFFKKIKPKNFKLVRFPYRNFNILYFPIKVFNYFRRIPSVEDPVSTGFRKISDLDAQKPDLVISNLCYYAYSWQAAAYCRKHKIPFFLQTEIKAMPDDFVKKSYVSLFLKFAKKAVFKDAKKILPWTSHSASFVEKNLGVDKNKICVIPPGIDTSLFRKRTKSEDEKFSNKSGKLKVLIVSRLTPYKRVEDALFAINELKDKKIELSIIGTGPCETQIKSTIEKLNLSSQVKFIEKVPRERLRQVYYSHDLLVLPSKNEAVGMVIPEAMACGLAVIASDTCGAATYMMDGVDSLIFKTGDYKDLALKIKSLKNSKYRKSLGSLGAESIKKNFSLEAVAKKLEAEIEKSLT